MAFFTNSVTALKTVVTAIGAGVAVWGIINLLEGYGNDNPGAKSQGIKHFMAKLMEHKKRKEKHTQTDKIIDYENAKERLTSYAKAC